MKRSGIFFIPIKYKYVIDFFYSWDELKKEPLSLMMDGDDGMEERKK